LGKFKLLPSRKSVKKAIDKGEIHLNGQKTETGYWLKGGEIITLVDLEDNPPKPYHLHLEVVYEDEYLAIINKPAGLLVSGNAFKTVTNALANNLTPSTQEDALKWPLPTHRLDKATSGLLIIAKTINCRIALGRLFENKEIEKTYHAIVMGEIPKSGIIDSEVDNKNAITHFETIKTVNSLRSKKLNLVQFEPKTGRTHQLRIHSACIGKSILGDSIYGDKNNTLKHKGLFLCATKLSFQHPILKRQIIAKIDYPKKYDKRLESEEKRWLKFN